MIRSSFLSERPHIRCGLGIVVISVLLNACAAKVQTKETPQKQTSAPVVVPDSVPSQAVVPRQPIVVTGTGKFINNANSASVPSVSNAASGYQLSFVDSDIPGVVASVIGEALGQPYLVDPQVKGNMTLQASRPLSREEVLPALEVALNLHGVALVNVDGVYNIVPLKDAPRRVTGLRVPGAATIPGFGVQIIPLRFVSAAEMEKVLRPFAPEGGILRVDDARNLLVLAGSSRDLATMQEFVTTFDVDWLAGMSFALYPVEYVDAKTLVEELGNIFTDSRSPIANVVRFVPLARLNSVMVITHDAAYLRQAEEWIRRLDVGATTPGRRIYVYDVQNGKAEDLADSLGRILSISVESSGARDDSRRDAFGSGTNEASRLGTPSGLAGQDPFGAGRYQPGNDANSQPGALKIVPSSENNSLLIFATPNEFSVIETALKRLDTPPIQVLIEASLAEVSLTDDLRYGLQWSIQGGDGPVVLSEANNGSISPSFPGFSYLFTGQRDIRAVLNAIETVTDVNVISSPKLLVLNNREAELQIGDQVPITVQSAVGTAIDTPAIVNSVQLRDTGVILRITPRVNRSGMVLLDVAQEVSDVVPTTTSNIDSPTIQQRRISSTVAVHNGETIALGGLIRDSKSRTRGGVPVLSKLPLVGGLFGSTNNNNRRTELIVLITPRVMRSAEDAEALLDELGEEFKSLRHVFEQKNKSAAGSSPSLPTEPTRDELQKK